MNKSRVVIVVTGILAMFQFLAGAAVLAEYVGAKPAGIFVLLVGAVQAGWAIIQQALVVPTGDVGAFVNNDGVMVAGPAVGVDNGQPVQVSPGGYLAGGGGTELRGDRGLTTVEMVLMIAALIVIVCGVIWLLGRA